MTTLLSAIHALGRRLRVLLGAPRFSGVFVAHNALTPDAPPFTVNAGVPSRVIGHRPQPTDPPIGPHPS